jgi:hypothetical protein
MLYEKEPQLSIHETGFAAELNTFIIQDLMPNVKEEPLGLRFIVEVCIQEVFVVLF